MKRYLGPAEGQNLSVFDRVDQCLRTDPASQDALPFSATEITTHSPTRVIAVRVGNHGTLDGTPRIDVEIALATVEAAIGSLEDRGAAHEYVLPPRNPKGSMSVRRDDP